MPDGGRAPVRTDTTVLDEAAVAAAGDGLKRGSYVALSVEDNGPGMAPEVLARAAEPFFTTKSTKGTGLGLAMVHGFMRQSGGRLEIASEPDRGTTVRMLFPVSSDAPPPPARSEPVLDPRGGAETILVVEDNDDVLDLAVHHLTGRGYAVLSARSGEEALEVLARAGGRVDLLFTDVLMPGGMNGLVLAERVRASFPAVRVLLATGYNEDLAGGLRQDADVLSKPYRETDLADRVRAVLNRPGARPGAAVSPPRGKICPPASLLAPIRRRSSSSRVRTRVSGIVPSPYHSRSERLLSAEDAEAHPAAGSLSCGPSRRGWPRRVR